MNTIPYPRIPLCTMLYPLNDGIKRDIRMSTSPEFVAYVGDQFTLLGNLEGESFFGGFAFNSDLKQSAMIMGNTLCFCVNDESIIKYKRLGMEPFSYATKKGRIQVNKYYSSSEDIFEDQEKLIEWENEAMQSAYSADDKCAIFDKCLDTACEYNKEGKLVSMTGFFET